MSTIKNSVAFSSGGKRDLDFGIPERLKSSQIVPGPGNYNKESTFSKTTKHSFSKTERMKGPATISPGPGSYLNTTTDAFQKKGPKFTVSKTVRPKDLFINIREGFQFFSKSTDGLRSEYPGPGRYELDGGNSKLKTRSVIILKSSKDIDYNNKIPGPGAYENDMTRVKSVMPKWTVSKTIREDPFLPENLKKELVTTPGVGNYNFSTSFGKGPKVNIVLFYISIKF